MSTTNTEVTVGDLQVALLIIGALSEAADIDLDEVEMTVTASADGEEVHKETVTVASITAKFQAKIDAIYELEGVEVTRS